MTEHEVDVYPLLNADAFGKKKAAREVIDAIDLASDQGQDTWLTLGEGGKRIARIVPADETTAAERVLGDQAQPGSYPLLPPHLEKRYQAWLAAEILKDA